MTNPSVANCWTVGLDDTGLKIAARVNDDSVSTFTVALKRHFAWLGFGWQDMEWTMNDLNVGAAVPFDAADPENVIPALRTERCGSRRHTVAG